MISVKDAKRISGGWKDMDGTTHQVYEEMFKDEEIERAESIVKSLEGLTILKYMRIQDLKQSRRLRQSCILHSVVWSLLNKSLYIFS